jgi:hypothetical protein
MTPGRGLESLIHDAVAAAVDGDPELFARAHYELFTRAGDHAGLVQAAIVRMLLEEQHPDGLDGSDVRELLSLATTACSWFSNLSEPALIGVLVGALGMPDTESTLGPAELSQHGCLLIATLLGTGRAPVDPYVAAAISEIRRAETVELP